MRTAVIVTIAAALIGIARIVRMVDRPMPVVVTWIACVSGLTPLLIAIPGPANHRPDRADRRPQRGRQHVNLPLWMPSSSCPRRFGLSDEERAALAGELIQSLEREVDADAEAAWSDEIRSRLERVDAGNAATIPWSEARRRIHAAAGRGPRA